MPINAYDTGRLERVIEGIVASNAEPVQFLARTFFSTVSRSDTEEIFFDVVDGKPRITPFVSPLVEGKVVANRGYETKSFKPAYLITESKCSFYGVGKKDLSKTCALRLCADG